LSGGLLAAVTGLAGTAASLLGIALAVAFLAAPPARGQDELTLGWSIPDRLNGRASIDEAAPARPLAVRIAVEGGCPADPIFEVEGDRVDVTAVGRCSFDLPPMAPGDYDVEVTAGSRTATATIAPRDHLVVSLGDSVASGEGNPDAVRKPIWLEQRCHRSLLSGAAQAALAAERGDRHSAITLVPLGCSGATIHKGLLGKYHGIERDKRKGPLAPQLDVLGDLERPVDAVLLSVGANDVNFGDLVAFCVSVDDCEDQRFDPANPDDPAAEPFPTVTEVVRNALTDLNRGYDELAARLDEEGVDPSRVIIVEYFDPLRNELGETCPHALPRVDLEEAEWAQRHVLAPLNLEVRAAAARQGWQLVSGVNDAFHRHGICADGARQSWVRRPVDSLLRQLRLSGTLHPNGDGHRATATLIAPLLGTTLGVGSGTEQILSLPDGERNGYVHWIWLVAVGVVAGLLGAGAALLIRSLVTRL